MQLKILFSLLCLILGACSAPNLRHLNIAKSVTSAKTEPTTCQLQSFQTVSNIVGERKVKHTTGRLSFRVTNNSGNSKGLLMYEVEIRNQQSQLIDIYGKPLASNLYPYRVFAETYWLNPPLEPGQAQEITREIEYTDIWKEVTLQKCQLIDDLQQFYRRYPKLKDLDIP